MIQLPLAAQGLLTRTANRAEALLADIETVPGVAEGRDALTAFGDRGVELGKKWVAGELATADLYKALESEREALIFTLAAIANENRRDLVVNLLTRAFDFVAKLAGLGL